MELKNRKYRLTIDGLQFEGLNFTAQIKKSLRPEPNCAQITVYNLSPDHQRQIEALNLYDPKRVKGQKRDPKKAKVSSSTPKLGRIAVELEAGYETTGMHLLWRGDLRRAVTTSDGSTATTELEGEDGGRSVISSRVQQSFPAGTTRYAVVEACAAAMGLGLGNIVSVAHLLQQPYTSGTLLSGQASAELSGVLRRPGITYSIQNGVLQFLAAGQGLNTTAFYLDSNTGMVGSPELDSSGQVVVTCLLLPTIAPGGFVQLQSKKTSGVFRIQTVEYDLELAGQAWYARLGLTPG
jgi:hypothetical protein